MCECSVESLREDVVESFVKSGLISGTSVLSMEFDDMQ